MAPPPVKQISATWEGRSMVFRGEAPGKPPIIIDGETGEGPSPMDALLIAMAGCTGSDVVSVLQKKRITLTALRLDVRGERREEFPRRYMKIDLVYHVTAPGASEQAVRQAIDLSLGKYCSVTHSLAPDIPVRYELRLQA